MQYKSSRICVQIFFAACYAFTVLYTSQNMNPPMYIQYFCVYIVPMYIIKISTYSIPIYQKIRACSSHLYMLHNFRLQCAPIWQKYFCSTGTTVVYDTTFHANIALVYVQKHFSLLQCSPMYVAYFRAYIPKAFSLLQCGQYTLQNLCAPIYVQNLFTVHRARIYIIILRLHRALIYQK